MPSRTSRKDWHAEEGDGEGDGEEPHEVQNSYKLRTNPGVAGTRVPRRGRLFPAQGRYAWVRRARRRTAATWVEVAVG